MSDMSTGQIVGGIVGAVIGFYVAGNPYAGAVQGAALGAGVGGYIDPPKNNIKIPQLGEKTFQSTAYGVSIPRLYGRVALHGNVIWLERNQYKSVSKKESQGGKGGGGTTVTTTTYFATFALVVGEPVPGYVPFRIWLGGKLVYQIRAAGVEYRDVSFKFYDGEQTEPDSRMEAVLGIGNCPSYNGTSYIVIYDLDLTNYGNGLSGCPVKIELGYAEFDGNWNNDFEIVGEFVATFPTSGWAAGAATLCPMPDVGSLYAAVARNTTGEDAVLNSSTDTGTAQQVNSVFGINDRGVSFATSGVYPGVCQSRTVAVGADWYENINDVSTIFSGCFIDGAFYRNPFTRVPNANSIEYVTPHRIYDSDGEVYFLGRSTLLAPPGHGVEPNQWYLAAFGGGIKVNFNFSGNDDLGCVIVGNARCVWIEDGVSENIVHIFSLDDGAEIKTFAIDLPYSFANGSGYNRPGIFIDESHVIFLMSGILKTAVGVLDLVVINIDTEVFFHQQVDGTGTGATSGFDYPSISIDENLLCIGQNQGDYEYRYWIIDLAPLTAGGETIYGKQLSRIVDQWVHGSGIAPEDFDSSALDDDYVLGYMVQDKTSARGATDQLRAVYMFDYVESGYSISCKKRGGDSIRVIPKGHLILNNEKMYSRSIESRVLMPATYTVNYVDPAREYDTGSETAEYPSPYENPQSVDFAIVMKAETAAQTADKLLKTAWNEGSIYSFSLPQIYLDLQVGDVVSVEFLDGIFTDVRIEARAETDSQILNISARSTNAFSYQSNAAGSQPIDDPVTPSSPGGSVVLLMDLPLIDDALDVAGFMTTAKGSGSNWPGAVLMRSVDGGQIYVGIDGYYGQGSYATADNQLSSHKGLVIDYSSQLKVWPQVGAFDSVSESQMMTGQNYFAYGINGRWEICQYAVATPNADGSITLSTLVRCLGGTEWASGLHASGDYVMLLQDADNRFVGMNGNSIGVEYLYKSPTIGQSVESVDGNVFTYQGVNLKPLSPVNVYARKSGSDWLVDFFERSRYSDSFWFSGATPRRETPIGFEMDIYKAGAVIRTLTAATTQFNYTSAQQIIDFGSVQNNLVAKIYQLNDRVGRGYPSEVNI